MATVVSSSTFPVNPQELFNDGFDLQTQNIIPQEDFQSTFNPEINTVELVILDQNLAFQTEIPNFLDWTIDDNINSDTNEFGGTNVISLDPSQDVINSGYDQGVLFTLYNFINYELNSSYQELYYISEISSDRTEIRLESNFITDSDIEYAYNIFKEKLEDQDFFDEFYISFKENRYYIAVNCELDTAGDRFSVLIKLYEPLPTSFSTQDECYVATKVAETEGYQVQLFTEDTLFDDLDYIKGPNTNLEIRDFVNNSTELKNKNQLTTANSNFTGSEQQLSNILNRRGVTIEPNYSFNTFDDFVHFSSVKARINNFITKLKRIESYESDLESLTSILGNTLTVPSQSLGAVADGGKDLIIQLQWNDIDPDDGSLATITDALTGSITQNVTDATDGTYTNIDPYTSGPGTGAILSIDVSAQSVLNITATSAGSGYIVEASSSLHVSQSISTLANKIQTEIKNMDGYEYYLYFNTSSLSYPKEGVGVNGFSFPYAPTASTSTEALTWLGSDITSNQYYGGILLSASRYDEDNKDWLFYTVPDYIKENTANDNYLDFVNMIGQHFDEIWLYTRAVTAKLNTTNVLDKGVPMQLADDVITSLGYTGLTNQYNNQDNFIGLVGENNREYCPPTGSEWILDHICINKGEVQNYWAQYYSWEDYVEQLITPGWPYPIDRVSKEIFKRLYHNMAYLVKTKGTPSGLRQLINIWGIPNSILRINEFGGKNKDNDNDYDLWYNRYSYAYKPISTQNVASSSVVMPWMPLYKNYVSQSNLSMVPDGFAFRFKTTGYPSSSVVGDYFSQSLAIKIANPDEISAELMDASTGELNNPVSTSGEFGIALYYTGSTSGSYDGVGPSGYEDWGIMKFYMSGSTAHGGVAESDPIYLPFFNKGWWTVLLQRNQHTENLNTGITYELLVANKLYHGYDGNQIGFTGSATINSGLDGNISSSINYSWNSFATASAAGIYLGGTVSSSIVGSDVNGGPVLGNVTMSNYGKIFSGSFQEFRYYGMPLLDSDGRSDKQKFFDFVMNPESIEGMEFSGSSDSYNMVNFRSPLGNELENFFTSSETATGLYNSYTESLRSLHPAVQNGPTKIDYTSSFLLKPVAPGTSVTSSNYHMIYYKNSSTRTYSETGVEAYYLDQPAIGVRNRVTNKIQIDDDDAFGKVLSNQRSIRQDYQISKSYTEDINNVEAGFSYQNEINDDIIQSFGFGALQDKIADPRLLFSVSGSTQADTSYYPNLRNLAKNYFKKYIEGNILDYMRLIKYFDNSVFKAIKNWAPARSGVATGIIIKQHMLERSRYPEPIVTLNENVAAVDQSPWNTYEVMQDLSNSGSLLATTITGSTAGVLNKYNQKNYFFSASSIQYSIAKSASAWDAGVLVDANVGEGNINQAFKFDSTTGQFSNHRNRDIIFQVVATIPSGIPTAEFAIHYSSSIDGISTLAYVAAPSQSGTAEILLPTTIDPLVPFTVKPSEIFQFNIHTSLNPYGGCDITIPSATWISNLNYNGVDHDPYNLTGQTFTTRAGIRFDRNYAGNVYYNTLDSCPQGTYMNVGPVAIMSSGWGVPGAPTGMYFDITVGTSNNIENMVVSTDSTVTGNGYYDLEANVTELIILGSSLGGNGSFRFKFQQEDFSPGTGAGAEFNIITLGGAGASTIVQLECTAHGDKYSAGDQLIIPTSLIGGAQDAVIGLNDKVLTTGSISMTGINFKFNPDGYVTYGGKEPHDKFAWNEVDGITSTTELMYTTGSVPVLNRAQAWELKNETPKGLVIEWDATEAEFFNGEFSGSKAIASTQSLSANNPFLLSSGDQNLSYYVYVYSGSIVREHEFLRDEGNLNATLTASNMEDAAFCNDIGVCKFYKVGDTLQGGLEGGGSIWSSWPY